MPDHAVAAVAADPLDHIADIPFADPIARGRLLPCLEKLAEMQRKAILMCYVHGYTNEELSRRLDRPPGTVKSWLSRGLADLRKCMG